MPRIKKVAPVVRTDAIETGEQQIGQDGVRKFDEATNTIPQLLVQPVEGDKPREWYEEMAFMNEPVTVMVHDSTDELANPFPEVWVNGRVQRFVRGEEQIVRRCFVERLARAKVTKLQNVKAKNVDGEDTYHYPTRTGLAYPFAVINDTAKGKAWLKKVLAEQ